MGQDDCVCEECPEWPLSMADMMTNLLCFFVLLVSIANFDESKFEEAVKAMGETFGGQVSQATVTERHVMQFDKEQSIQAIKEALRALFRKQENIYTVKESGKGLLITIPSNNIFRNKKADFNSRARYILERIAIVMENIKFPVRIEGHTDDSPPKSKSFPSNWELTVAQASAISRFFIEHGMPSKNLTVMAYADNRPLVNPKDSEDSKAENKKTKAKKKKLSAKEKQKNQRIEIFISSLVPQEPQG
ncbi:MAG: chemotaxis protein MotB [Candidatus Magnetoglobus multicellularis str. Araruama]|uniref:Chemotaxis protein MotB n=1 Tax=Candidatus Magnetoglobus multicellularis str. Araruama TaxID=890399 RepID=A0A1V1PBI6_9BACT|nr:MAG: chemotaxis protein MotB [Candidatus Magnetoglobus multicellularis str. Araruama]